MNESEFARLAELLPEWIILDIPEVARQYRAMFNHLAEYALHMAFICLMDRHHYRHSVHKATNRLLGALVVDLESRQDLEYDEGGMKMDFRPMFMEHLLAFERGIQDIRHRLDELRLNVIDRYTPYEFETLMPTGEVLLRRMTQLVYLDNLVAE